jgi:hypothetical protein
MHGLGYLIAVLLILAGILQAVGRGWLIDGLFLLLAGGGVMVAAVTHLTESN